MEKNKCVNMHKFGPFVINNGMATRKCFCCNEIVNYDKIGEDIKLAVKNQDDVSFFADLIINKKFKNGIEDFVNLVYCIYKDFDYLYINKESQKKLIDNINYYSELLVFDDDIKNQISNICNYFKLSFKRDEYEYVNGFDSFKDNSLIDGIVDIIDKEFISDLNKKNHLSK